MIATAPTPHTLDVLPVPPWPTCSSCRDWRAAACAYEPRTGHAWRHPAAPADPAAACAYWHSPSGETRRARCKAVNAALARVRPPVPAKVAA